MLYGSVRVVDIEWRSATFAEFVGRHIDETALGAFRISHLILRLRLGRFFDISQTSIGVDGSGFRYS